MNKKMFSAIVLIVWLSTIQSLFSQTCLSSNTSVDRPFYATDFERNSYVRISNAQQSSGMQWYMDEDFTLEFWVYPQWDVNSEAYEFMFGYGRWDDDFNSFLVAFESKSVSGWAIRVSDGNDSGSNSDLIWEFSKTDYTNNWKDRWNHVCVTFDSPSTTDEDGTVRLYVNGSLKQTQTGFDLISYSSSDGNYDRQTYTYLGEGLGGSTAEDHDESFYGYMSGFRHWDMVLDQSQISYVKDKTFHSYESFSGASSVFTDIDDVFHNKLIVNMLRDYTSSNSYNINSSTHETLGIGMVEYNMNTNYNEYHPAHPPKVYNLTISKTCITNRLDWEKDDHGTAYVYRKRLTTPAESNYTLLCRTNSNYYIDEDIEAATEYEYYVTNAWYNNDNPLNESSSVYQSEEEHITVLTKMYAQVQNLDVPHTSCDGTVELTWVAPDALPVAYTIKYQVNGTWYTLNSNVNSSLTSYTYDVDVNDYGKEILYKIDGGGDGCENWSATTSGMGNKACTAAPSNAQSDTLNGNIYATWDYTAAGPGGPPTEFKVYRKEGSAGSFELLDNSISPDAREYEDGTALMCNEYYYKIEAWNSCNTAAGPTSLQSNYSVLENKFDNVFTYVENAETKSYFDASKGYFNQKVVLEWTANPNKLGDVDYYEIYRKKNGETFSLLTTVNNANATYYEDISTEANEMYIYYIQAVGDCAGVETRSDTIGTVGFRTSTGIVAGKITYQGGNAVENAEVRICSEESVQSYSLYFDGIQDYLGTDKFVDDSLIYQPFSCDVWVKPSSMTGNEKKIIFSAYSGIFYLGLSNMRPVCGINSSIMTGNIQGTTALVTVQSDSVLNADEWAHLAVNFDPETGLMQLYVNGEFHNDGTLDNSMAVLQAMDVDNINLMGANKVMVGSANGYSNFYKGNIDEVRLYQSVRSDVQIENDHTRILNGNEAHLIAYYRLDEGFGTAAYDISKTDGEFNKRHLVVPQGNEQVFATWSNQTPSFEQLHPSGITDANGNYVIKGVRYSGSGNIFSVVPFLGVHEFNPTDVNLFIGDSEPVHNNVDFTDQSSFRATGRLTYENTNMPVKNAYVKIDGNYIQGYNNQAVMTDNSGQFDIQVPIGEHYISVEKSGHTFVSAYYPLQQSDSAFTYHFFNEPIYNIEFFDNTTVKLAGRVVGGAVEQAKPLGSDENPIVNNLGICKLTFTTEQDYILDVEDGNKTTLVVYTNDNTGMYEINLPPEVYKIDTVKVNNEYNFLVGESQLVSLTNCFPLQYTIDTVDNDGSMSLDTTYEYNLEKNWIWRSTPQLSVDNIHGTKFLGDEEYIVNAGNDTQDTINIAGMVNDTAYYNFGKPVYSLGQPYQLIVTAFETYTNDETGVVDTVVVSDGELQIINECANNTNQVSLGFNDNGQALYEFFGGYPNLSAPYTKKLEVKLLVGSNYYEWSQSPFYGYVSGNIPTGSNFVTKGPTSIDFVLRDPPGSNSYSYMEAGLEISKTVTTSSSHGQTGNSSLVYQLGTSTTFVTGTPFFSTQTEFEVENNIGVGVEHSHVWGNEFEENVTIEFNQSFSTSEDPAYVGDMGDLFLGHGNNLIYGLSNFINIMDVDEVPVDGETIEDTILIDGTYYTIAKKTGLHMGKEVSTTFIYTQNHIENYLIPNLQMIRNLAYDNNNEYYTLVETDTESSNFLSNNDDNAIWGAQASDDKYDGPSYVFSNPDNDDLIDSVRYYNNQINKWIKVLKNNEKAKVTAVDDPNFPSNISFDAGVVYEASVEIDSLSSENKTFEFTLSPHFMAELGFSVNGFGFTLNLEEGYEYTTANNTVNDTTTSQTIGFVLADGDGGDYFSVDVRKDAEEGYGPIFRTVGGQSSCPYEGAVYTEYYNPGTLLSQATMQIEMPNISVDNNIVAGVPETEAAVFNLAMSNNSETGDDGWYNLYVEPTSNPNGAVVKMDGASISGTPVAVLIPAGQTVYKALTIEKGQQDINEYEDIQVILHSQCQFDPTDDVDDIADTIIISAYFTPTCTSVDFEQIYDNWTANVYNNDTLSFNISDYNINSTEFETIEFQYAIPGGSRTTAMVFYKDETDFLDADEPKTWINGNATMAYSFPLSSLNDGQYQIYLKSNCSDGSEYITDPLNGVIDRVVPTPFGTPQPSDGVLSYGEDISVKFNETINSGDLYSHVDYVDVRGITNGTDLTNNPYLLHDASIHFDGIANNLQVNHINLDHTNFTIEFWAKRDAIDQRSNLVSVGSPSQGGLWIGFDAANHFVVEVDGQTISSSETYTNIGNWAFYSVVYNQGDEETEAGFTLFALSDAGGTPEVFEADVYTSLEGSLSIGYCADDASAFYGNMHEFRIWNYARTSTEIAAQKAQILNGYEQGLYGLWPMNEANGDRAEDIAFGRNAIVNATWQVGRNGHALALNGSNVLDMPAGQMAFSSQSDFTLEFWYKMAMPVSNATLVSNGNFDEEPNINSWNITAGSDGNITITNNGNNVTIAAQNYLDDQWHHFAMSMNRIGYLSVYFDGELVKTQSVANFEGFGASRLVLGARWWNLSMQDYYDQFTTGMIDEFRVWNAARTQSQIKRYMSHNLVGDELGLKAYVPFEDVTIADPSISNETSANFTQDNIGIAGDTLIESAYFTTESPNIKLQLPEVSIPHTYVVNDDEVVITPNIQANLIENQILDISIKRVKDMNNNMMPSTLSWNAFVDKNQVVWNLQDLTIEKFVEEETTVTVDIQNKGGLNENYQILNIPSWMNVSPSSGTLTPLETETIEITILPELNIGSYQTDISLVASMDYNERLGVSVQVNGHAPDWSVDPSNFDLSANVIGQLSVNNTLSTDENDIVACFVGDECRGVSHVTYFEDANIYLTFISAYANTNGETMYFKVYDASTGNVYTRVTPEFTFAADQLYGSVSNPLPINATNYIEQNIQLDAGWNWISFNVYSDEFNDLNTAFSQLNQHENDFVKDQQQFAYVRANGYWFGELDQLKVTSAYKLKVAQAQTLVMSGYRVVPDTIQIPIAAGWNWVGYPLSVQKPIDEALSSLNPQDDDMIKSQHQFAVYSSVLGWVGSLTYMQAGEGYVMYSANGGVLNYDGGLVSRSVSQDPEIFNLPSTEDNMAMIIELQIDNPSAYTLKAYNEAGLCGEAEAQILEDGSVRHFITINANSKEVIRFEAVHHLGSMEANEHMVFFANDRQGTLDEPFELSFNKNGFEGVSNISVYPNPFNHQVTIGMVLEYDQAISYTLYNALGEVVVEMQTLKLPEGYHDVELLKDAVSKLAEGVYIVKVNVNGNTEIMQLIKE
ncbi:MAG: T9SS type A sorting domain-containing protein [Bacteroidales bacterium]|nr:T9SS type A sorting domain-containing protein [Bacteroidales bacterium]